MLRLQALLHVQGDDHSVSASAVTAPPDSVRGFTETAHRVAARGWGGRTRECASNGHRAQMKVGPGGRWW